MKTVKAAPKVIRRPLPPIRPERPEMLALLNGLGALFMEQSRYWVVPASVPSRVLIPLGQLARRTWLGVYVELRDRLARLGFKASRYDLTRDRTGIVIRGIRPNFAK
jgi:hypothetical protein